WKREFDVGAFLVNIIHAGSEFELGWRGSDDLNFRHLQVLAFEHAPDFLLILRRSLRENQFPLGKAHFLGLFGLNQISRLLCGGWWNVLSYGESRGGQGVGFGLRQQVIPALFRAV